MNPFRILIVKLAAIGDVVMALPLLPAIRQQYPNAHITWVCGNQVKPLLEATKEVDRILALDESQLFKGTLFTKFSAIFRIWKSLAGKRFDLVLTLNPDPRYRILSWPVHAKEKRHWGWHNGRFRPIPGRAHSQEYLALLDGLDGPAERVCRFPSLHLPPPSLSPSVVIAPGGAKNVLAEDALRRWPITHYAALVRQLNQHNVTPLVIGNAGDAWILPYLAGTSFLNYVGKLDLLALLSSLQQAQLLITHDSGPLHLAKLVECQVLALFGPTNPWEKVQPNEKVRVLWGGERLACRPCYNGKTYAPCRNNLCLAQLSPERVCEEAMTLLSKASALC